MSFFESVPSPKIADDTLGGQRNDDLSETRIPLPTAESDFFKHRTEPVYSCANEVKSASMNDNDKVASAIASNSDILRLKHVKTDPDVTTMPADQASSPFSDSSKKRFRVSRKGVIIATMLGLATGIAIGGEWSSPHTFIENLKAANLHGVIETIFADSPKAELSAQQALQPARATDTKLSEIADQLVGLASDLSSVKENMEELKTGQEQIRKVQEQLAQTQFTGQEQIRKAQEQLAQMQLRFAALQAQANLKQNAQPNPHVPDARRLNRRDVYYYPLR
jgi:hypothetical protein